MRILFIAMANSIHTARWINQIVDEGWDIHLFPSTDSPVSPDLRNLTVHDGIIRYPGIQKNVRQYGAWPWPFPESAELADLALKRVRREQTMALSIANRGKRLARVIRRIRPDIVHSLEIQHAGYVTLDAKIQLAELFPTWIVTNWGSDIYLFGRLEEHAGRIRSVLAACDYYSCECHRDVALGRTFGFGGPVLPVLPNTGGFDLKKAAQFRQAGPTSARRLILLKGYQNWAGRALVGLRAIQLCAENLRDYRLAVYSATEDVRMAAELVSQNTGIPLDLIPPCSHDDILRLYGQARIYVGLSISDAISTSLLEAIVMGAFPIQSCTACADEWITDGQTGLIVPPEDPESIADAIRRAVSDDALVDDASEINMKLASERLDHAIVKEQVVSMYKEIRKGIR